MKKKTKIIIAAVNALLLILIGICLIRIASDSTKLVSQQAAVSWKGESEERFAQVSCYFPVDKTVGEDAIYSFRRTIDSKLTDAGVEPRKEESGSNWTDCYSAVDSLTVEGERNTSEVTAIGVGGDFFLFHPYQLESGSFISEDDIMKDRVVLDYELAWKLFGGASLEGMTVKINGVPYYIAGVVRRETDKFSEKAFSGEPVMYMSFSTLNTLKEQIGIDSYEMVISDPISGFAKNLLTEGFNSYNGVVVENSTRYDFTSIFSMFTHFGSRSIENSGVAYPYWENAARISEVYVARLYVFIFLLSLFPLICLITLVIRLSIFVELKRRKLVFEAKEAWDDRVARKAAWKERRDLKRREKTLRKHSKAVKKTEKAEKSPSDKAEDELQSEIMPDIESIVKEIMEEMENESSTNQL